MSMEEINQEIFHESDYIEVALGGTTEDYTLVEVVNGAQAVQDEREVEMLSQLDAQQTIYDIYYPGIGDALSRLESKEMVERPDNGSEFVRLTPLSRTYLQHYRENIV